MSNSSDLLRLSAVDKFPQVKASFNRIRNLSQTSPLNLPFGQIQTAQSTRGGLPYWNGCSLAGMIHTQYNCRIKESLSKFAALYPICRDFGKQPQLDPLSKILGKFTNAHFCNEIKHFSDNLQA